MSGTFERRIYDANAYKIALEQSTAPLRHVMDPGNYNRCDPCRPADIGYIGNVGVSITHQRPLIDVESDLRLLNYPLSKDPAQQYQPSCPQCGRCFEGYPCGGGVVAGCKDCQERLFHFPACSIGTDYTRISNPKCSSREVGVNRFQPLCLNPQDENRWLPPSEVGINYRMVVKDNHVPCIPKPLDPTPLLPTGSGPIVSPMVQYMGVHREPLHRRTARIDYNWNGNQFV